MDCENGYKPFRRQTEAKKIETISILLVISHYIVQYLAFRNNYRNSLKDRKILYGMQKFLIWKLLRANYMFEFQKLILSNESLDVLMSIDVYRCRKLKIKVIIFICQANSIAYWKSWVITDSLVHYDFSLYIPIEYFFQINENVSYMIRSIFHFPHVH